MNKTIRIGTCLFLIIAVAIVSCVGTYYFVGSKIKTAGDTITKKEELVSKLIKANGIVLEKYLGEVDNEKLVDGIMKGYVSSIGDQYSAYLDKENYRAAIKNQNAEFVGIGVKVGIDSENEGWRINYVMPGSPASESGLHIGDIIIKVGDNYVIDEGYYVAYSDLVSGNVAKFTVLRGSEVIDFEIARKEFSTQSVEDYIMLDNNIAFLRILEFDASTPGKFSDQLYKAIDAGAKGIIFDLRNNPGGTLDSVVTVLSGILPEGDIVTIKFRDDIADVAGEEKEPEVYKSEGTSELSIPAVVLVNGNTASAAELFTACLRDYGKAVIVGTTTFGKGVGQETIPLGDETAIRITTFSYYPPNGENYNGVGITPNYEVVSEIPDYEIYGAAPSDDVQICNALEILSAQ